ncbi:CDP-glucose 4,6-dehydratase [bacterium]|nr:CDP-glucose 4,6-dehydratase [bacterium]
MFTNAFQGKRVLVTGHTGFKGSWLCEWLLRLNAEVHGISLPATEGQELFSQLHLLTRIDEHFEVDIRDAGLLSSVVQSVKPDFVFHLAAQPLVRKSYHEPALTVETNVMGTINVLEALRGLSSACTAIIITTDKCYENREWLHAYRESDALGGHDPYSASKACAEVVTHCYRNSFFSSISEIRVASARAGNVIGGGDWAEDRIVPDIVQAVRSGSPVEVRNRYATRPWQHVLEPLSGYLRLASVTSSATFQNARQFDSFNFGPNLDANRSVADLVQEFLTHMDGTWVDKTVENEPHEAGRLNLAIDKAHHLLGWMPCWDFAKAVSQTSRWYQNEVEGGDVLGMTQQQIDEYCSTALKKQISWALKN